MNNYNLPEVTVRDILRVIKPSNEDWSVRFHIINEVRAVVGSVESLRGGLGVIDTFGRIKYGRMSSLFLYQSATVEPFGSFASNLFTKWGDLDISIELQNGSYISSPGKKHKQSLLADVLKALRKKGT
ncbi:hypothetical protein OROGR_011295 [Orobanche gracilis]